ncbi:hypothetical protein Syun_018388 [Stephania yunnanensis]|uniref:Uncharacterized protein n=1 Tax=Stephania yunnanensis TaxID=152371 RepID=A0AAP0IS73_9MAGN
MTKARPRSPEYQGPRRAARHHDQLLSRIQGKPKAWADQVLGGCRWLGGQGSYGARWQQGEQGSSVTALTTRSGVLPSLNGYVTDCRLVYKAKCSRVILFPGVEAPGRCATTPPGPFSKPFEVDKDKDKRLATELVLFWSGRAMHAIMLSVAELLRYSFPASGIIAK